jgi:hypothetical protein
MAVSEYLLPFAECALFPGQAGQSAGATAVNSEPPASRGAWTQPCLFISKRHRSPLRWAGLAERGRTDRTSVRWSPIRQLHDAW